MRIPFLIAALLCLLGGHSMLTDSALAQRSGARQSETARPGRGILGPFTRFRLPNTNERNHLQVRSAFTDVVHQAHMATVRVQCRGMQVALGTIVHPDGYIVTKASELGDGISVLLSDDRRFPATRVAEDEATDLALLKIDGENLPTVPWAEETALPVGSWLATAGLDEVPAAVGVVSAPLRAIPEPRPLLGVSVEDDPKGARVASVVASGPAWKAGLQSDDVIVELDGKPIAGQNSLIDAIAAHQAGDRVAVVVLRNDVRVRVQATLTDQTRIGNPEQAELMESLGGPLSKRRYGFPSVLQHDSVLRPRDCGGPIVDLEGHAVGINIARASRVASYALPAHEIQRMLKRWLPEAAPAVSDPALRAVSVDR